MKKLIIGLLMAAMMTLGLVSVSAGASDAVNCATYPGCVKTKLKIKKTSKLNASQTQKVRVSVVVPGNAVATGSVTVTVSRVGGGYNYSETKTYSGGTVVFKAKNLAPRGTFKIKAAFTGDIPFADAVNSKKKFQVK